MLLQAVLRLVEVGTSKDAGACHAELRLSLIRELAGLDLRLSEARLFKGRHFVPFGTGIAIRRFKCCLEFDRICCQGIFL